MDESGGRVIIDNDIKTSYDGVLGVLLYSHEKSCSLDLRRRACSSYLSSKGCCLLSLREEGLILGLKEDGVYFIPEENRVLIGPVFLS